MSQLSTNGDCYEITMLVLGCTNDKQFQLRKIFSFCELAISSILFSKYKFHFTSNIFEKGKEWKKLNTPLFNGDPFSILELCCIDKLNKHTGAQVIKLKNIQNKPIYIYTHTYMATHQFQVRSTTIYLIKQKHNLIKSLTTRRQACS